MDISVWAAAHLAVSASPVEVCRKVLGAGRALSPHVLPSTAAPVRRGIGCTRKRPGTGEGLIGVQEPRGKRGLGAQFCHRRWCLCEQQVSGCCPQGGKAAESSLTSSLAAVPGTVPQCSCWDTRCQKPAENSACSGANLLSRGENPFMVKG